MLPPSLWTVVLFVAATCGATTTRSPWQVYQGDRDPPNTKADLQKLGKGQFESYLSGDPYVDWRLQMKSYEPPKSLFTEELGVKESWFEWKELPTDLEGLVTYSQLHPHCVFTGQGSCGGGISFVHFQTFIEVNSTSESTFVMFDNSGDDYFVTVYYLNWAGEETSLRLPDSWRTSSPGRTGYALPAATFMRVVVSIVSVSTPTAVNMRIDNLCVVTSLSTQPYNYVKVSSIPSQPRSNGPSYAQWQRPYHTGWKVYRNTNLTTTTMDGDCKKYLHGVQCGYHPDGRDVLRWSESSDDHTRISSISGYSLANSDEVCLDKVDWTFFHTTVVVPSGVDIHNTLEIAAGGVDEAIIVEAFSTDLSLLGDPGQPCVVAAGDEASPLDPSNRETVLSNGEKQTLARRHLEHMGSSEFVVLVKLADWCPPVTGIDTFEILLNGLPLTTLGEPTAPYQHADATTHLRTEGTVFTPWEVSVTDLDEGGLSLSDNPVVYAPYLRSAEGGKSIEAVKPASTWQLSPTLGGEPQRASLTHATGDSCHSCDDCRRYIFLQTYVDVPFQQVSTLALELESEMGSLAFVKVLVYNSMWPDGLSVPMDDEETTRRTLQLNEYALPNERNRIIIANLVGYKDPFPLVHILTARLTSMYSSYNPPSETHTRWRSTSVEGEKGAVDIPRVDDPRWKEVPPWVSPTAPHVQWDSTPTPQLLETSVMFGNIAIDRAEFVVTKNAHVDPEVILYNDRFPMGWRLEYFWTSRNATASQTWHFGASGNVIQRNALNRFVAVSYDAKFESAQVVVDSRPTVPVGSVMESTISHSPWTMTRRHNVTTSCDPEFHTTRSYWDCVIDHVRLEWPPSSTMAPAEWRPSPNTNDVGFYEKTDRRQIGSQDSHDVMFFETFIRMPGSVGHRDKMEVQLSETHREGQTAVFASSSKWMGMSRVQLQNSKKGNFPDGTYGAHTTSRVVVVVFDNGRGNLTNFVLGHARLLFNGKLIPTHSPSTLRSQWRMLGVGNFWRKELQSWDLCDDSANLLGSRKLLSLYQNFPNAEDFTEVSNDASEEKEEGYNIQISQRSQYSCGGASDSSISNIQLKFWETSLFVPMGVARVEAVANGYSGDGHVIKVYNSVFPDGVVAAHWSLLERASVFTDVISPGEENRVQFIEIEQLCRDPWPGTKPEPLLFREHGMYVPKLMGLAKINEHGWKLRTNEHSLAFEDYPYSPCAKTSNGTYSLDCLFRHASPPPLDYDWSRSEHWTSVDVLGDRGEYVARLGTETKFCATSQVVKYFYFETDFTVNIVPATIKVALAGYKVFPTNLPDLKVGFAVTVNGGEPVLSHVNSVALVSSGMNTGENRLVVTVVAYSEECGADDQLDNNVVVKGFKLEAEGRPFGSWVRTSVPSDQPSFISDPDGWYCPGEPLSRVCSTTKCDVRDLSFEGPAEDNCKHHCFADHDPFSEGAGECFPGCSDDECAWCGGACERKTSCDTISWHGCQYCTDYSDMFNQLTCCPFQCEDKSSDGQCDFLCNIRACGFDGGDCSCPHMTVGDGICDEECFNAHCWYDAGDCLEGNESVLTGTIDGFEVRPATFYDFAKRDVLEVFTETSVNAAGEIDGNLSGGDGGEGLPLPLMIGAGAGGILLLLAIVFYTRRKGGNGARNDTRDIPLHPHNGSSNQSNRLIAGPPSDNAVADSEFGASVANAPPAPVFGGPSPYYGASQHTNTPAPYGVPPPLPYGVASAPPSAPPPPHPSAPPPPSSSNDTTRPPSYNQALGPDGGVTVASNVGGGDVALSPAKLFGSEVPPQEYFKNYLDSNNRGYVTKPEFMLATRLHAPKRSPDEWSALYSSIDHLDNGVIEMGEFVHWWNETSDASPHLRPRAKSLHTDVPEVLECCVCLTNKKSIIFKPCNHLCVCKECSQKLTKCPLCKVEVDSREKVWL